MPTVLNVDDSEERLRYRSMVLAESGFAVIEARTGTEALLLAREGHPALVLLDVHLPDLDGFEVCRRLKASPLTESIPVLHVSAAYPDDEHEIEGLRGGADSYLREPVSAEVLVEVIRALLRRVSAEAAARLARDDAERERQRLEEQLRQSQKLEAIGQLAGGIAHDFNNTLTVILSYADMLARQVGPDDPLGRDLDEIRRSAEHAAALTHRLLAFAHQQPMRLAPVDLNAVVADANAMLHRLVGERVMIVTHLESLPCTLMADAVQLQQVIVNLVVNARDAMPDGGVVTIETALLSIGAGDRGRGALEPGRYVHLVVRDTGAGMDAETQRRVFEPFFTTKDVGQGTGLGLATVYGIVRQLGGAIDVESVVDQGTRFDLHFPWTNHQPERVSAPSIAEAVLPIAATVLVVEDDGAVRTLVVNALQRHGYHVVEVSGPMEALQLTDASLGAVDLLVTDIVMPFMSGRVLARRLCARRPELRVLYISGYGDREPADSAEDAALLRKPFTAPAMLAAVQAAIRSAV